jgi:hypothetical protein
MKYFRTIEDLPIWNFEKVSETGDIRYILKLEDYFELPEEGFDPDALVDVFIKVSDDLFDNFGVDDKAITKMIEEKDLLILKLRWLSGERTMKAIFNIKNKIVEERESQKGPTKQSFNERIVMLESYFKKDFDVYKMSVSKFYTYLNLYKKANS